MPAVAEFFSLGVMLAITHTTPKRVLSHLFRLKREGEAMLASRDFLTPFDDARWASRLIDYLKRIYADPFAFDRVIFRDFAGLPLNPEKTLEPTRKELDQIVRRNISCYLVTLASVIEQVEMVVEAEADGSPNT
jgi:hypothetical protein